MAWPLIGDNPFNKDRWSLPSREIIRGSQVLTKRDIVQVQRKARMVMSRQEPDTKLKVCAFRPAALFLHTLESGRSEAVPILVPS